MNKNKIDFIAKNLKDAKNNVTDLQKELEQAYNEIVLDAMIIGCDFQIKHGSIAPYEHGYYVKSNFLEKHFCEPVTCKENWITNMPDVLRSYLSCVRNWEHKDFMALKQRVDDAWNARNESYIKDAYEIKSYGNHVANGYETEGLNQIVKGQLHGTWSTCTTSSQNDTTEELVILRGFCTDYYLNNKNHVKQIDEKILRDILYRHEPEEFLIDDWDLTDYAKDHPDRMFA